LRCFNNCVGSFGQAVGSNDVESAFGQQFGAQFGVVAFEANDDRHFDANLLDRTDDAFGNQITTHDTAEDVDEYGFDAAVRQDDLECFRDALFGGAAADVEEVGRSTAVQFDDVHCAHGQTGAVNHAADIAVESDIV